MAGQDEEPINHFRFLDLPAELRNRIYEAALILTIAIMLPSACKHPRRCEAAQPALTRVNRQIRGESIPIFYHENRFEYHVHGCDFGYFIDFMDTIGEDNRRHMNMINFFFKDRWTCGKGLHDFVRWCTQMEGIENMTIAHSPVAWNWEYAKGMRKEEQDALWKDAWEYDAFMGKTMTAFETVFTIAEQLYQDDQTRDLQIRQGWDKALIGMGFACQSCDKRAYESGLIIRKDLTGHCSDMCRFVEIGTPCNEALEE